MARTTPPAVIPPEKHAPKRGALSRAKQAIGRAAKKGLDAEAKYGGGITAITGAVGATAGAAYGAGPIGAVVGTAAGEGWRAAYRGAAKKAAAWDAEEALHVEHPSDADDFLRDAGWAPVPKRPGLWSLDLNDGDTAYVTATGKGDYLVFFVEREGGVSQRRVGLKGIEGAVRSRDSWVSAAHGGGGLQRKRLRTTPGGYHFPPDYAERLGVGTLVDMSAYMLVEHDREHNDEVFAVYRERRQALRHGRGDALDPWDVPMQELVRGQVVEMEHTDDPLTAIEIAMDHLAEDRHYYTKLATIHEDLPDARDEALDALIEELARFYDMLVEDPDDVEAVLRTLEERYEAGVYNALSPKQKGELEYLIGAPPFADETLVWLERTLRKLGWKDEDQLAGEAAGRAMWPSSVWNEGLHLGPTSRRRLAQGVRAAGRVGAALEGATVKGGAFVGGAIGGSLGASAGSAGGPLGTVVGGGVGAAAGGAAGRGLVLAGASFRREAERRALGALEGEYEEPEALYSEALRSRAPTARRSQAPTARKQPRPQRSRVKGGTPRSRTRAPQRPVALGSHTCLVPEGAVTVRGSSSDKCRAPGTNTPAWQQYVAYAKWVLDRHGVKLDAKPLGCGSYGCAFGLPGRTDVVVKITGDRAEAAALLRVNEAVASEQTSWDRLPALAKASCIYGMLDDCDRPLPIFVITQERLPKRLSKDAGQIVNDYWTQILDVAAGKKDTQNIRGWSEQVLGEDGLAELDALIATVAELSRIGVHWTDLHEGNVMADAKGHWKIVDLGFSRSPDTTVGALSPTQGPVS